MDMEGKGEAASLTVLVERQDLVKGQKTVVCSALGSLEGRK